MVLRRRRKVIRVEAGETPEEALVNGLLLGRGHIGVFIILNKASAGGNNLPFRANGQPKIG